MIIAAILIIILIFINPTAFCILKWNKYRRSEYFRLTKNPYLQTALDKGRYGEYLTYCKLSKIQSPGKFLFNVYIPKNDGTTTEIDMLLIHGSGIYVFESKNYSGWIFGNETQKYWTQTLPQGKGKAPQKNKFLNPIFQNKGHIKALRAFLDNEQLPVRSVIVFSERCELKKIEVTDAGCIVVKRDDLPRAIRRCVQQSGTVLSPGQIEGLFQKLYPLTQVSEEQKQAHIDNIKRNQSQSRQ